MMQNKTQYFDDELSLNDVFNQIKVQIQKILLYKKALLISVILGLILGYVFFKIQNIRYKAEINFVLDDEKQGSMGGVNSVASQLGIDLGSSGNGIFSGDNLIYLFKSRSIIEKTLLSKIDFDHKKISLAEYYLLKFNPKKYKEKKLENINEDSLSIEQIDLLNSIRGEILKNILDVRQKDKKTSIITIEVISKDELFSKFFCEKIAERVSSFYVETRSKKARLNRDILQHQVDSVKDALYYAIDGVARANDNVYNLNPASLISKTASTKRTTDIQANTAVLSQLVTNLELAKITVRKETPLIQIIDRPILPLDKVSLSLFMSEVIFLFSISFAFIVVILFRQKTVKKL